MNRINAALDDGTPWCAKCFCYVSPGHYEHHHLAPKAVFKSAFDNQGRGWNFLNRWVVPVCKGSCHSDIQRLSDGALQRLADCLRSRGDQGAMWRAVAAIHTQGLFGFALAGASRIFDRSNQPWSPEWRAALAAILQISASTGVNTRPRGVPQITDKKFLKEAKENGDLALILAIANAATCKRRPELARKLVEEIHDVGGPDKEFLQASILRRLAASTRDKKHAEDALRSSKGLPHAEITATISSASISAAEGIRASWRVRRLIDGINPREVSWLHRSEMAFLNGLLALRSREWRRAYESLIESQYITAMLGLQPSPMFRTDLVDPGSRGYLVARDLLCRIQDRATANWRFEWRRNALERLSLRVWEAKLNAIRGDEQPVRR